MIGPSALTAGERANNALMIKTTTIYCTCHWQNVSVQTHIYKAGNTYRLKGNSFKKECYAALKQIKYNTPFHTFWFDQPFAEGYSANSPQYFTFITE